MSLNKKDIKKRIFGNELNYVKSVLEKGFRASTSNEMAKKLEDTFSKIFNVKHAISFTNGTSTMHAALEAWGIGVGDEVIVPPLTMSATSFAVLQSNATPIFADVDIETFQICPKSIESKITKKTRAIITVALFGSSPNMKTIKEIAEKYKLKILEDNAECYLGKFNNELIGTFGDCASFSFQNSKHLTSGEGGILITNDTEFADNVRKVQSMGYANVSASSGKVTKKTIQDPNYSRHVTLGWNYRMPELCCAVALAQVENIELLVKRRIEVAKLFSEVSKDFNEWFIPQFIPKNVESSFWTWVVKLEKKNLSWQKFRDEFQKNGGDGIYAAWKLTYNEPFFNNNIFLGREAFISDINLKKYKKGLCPNAEYLQPRLLCFKTNYWDFNNAIIQSKVLRKTLENLN